MKGTPIPGSRFPTPYPDVNAVLITLLERVQVLLGDNFVGMYLYGSLANGDFDPLRSDVDFLVVTGDALSSQVVQSLAQMHVEISRLPSKWALELEGTYMSQDELRVFQPERSVHPHIDRGENSLIVQQHHADWVIQRYVLREMGITLHGPPIKTLIDPIDAEDLRRAVTDILDFWFRPMVSDPGHLLPHGYRSYAVLSMCRMAYTLEYGGIISKLAAARWALDNLDARWHETIRRASEWLEGRAPPDLADTRALIQFTLDSAHKKEYD